ATFGPCLKFSRERVKGRKASRGAPARPHHELHRRAVQTLGDIRLSLPTIEERSNRLPHVVRGASRHLSQARKADGLGLVGVKECVYFLHFCSSTPGVLPL